MKKIRLIHWKADELMERVARLQDEGFAVEFTDLEQGQTLLRKMRQNPPHAVVIDLSRLPSQGRDLALHLRQSPATRSVPLIFVGGSASKVSQVKKSLPDAAYCRWKEIGEAVRRAMSNPPRDPVVPESVLAGYSGTPLPKKLGIKPGMTVALSGAPEGFRATLGSLPEDVALRRRMQGHCDLIVWFVDSASRFKGKLPKVAARDDFQRLWIAWPKKASGVKTDVTQTVVRESGLAQGLVDFKICAIDAVWSGLAFTRRKK
ncbi:MAG TPA: hypothetical protein VLV83_05430 [Acidobacteriota bacterium]|nr:hypothetical protein [Acidobacteriota bacterium]